MKKYLLILIAALATLTAAAETFSPGGKWENASSSSGNWFDCLPVYLEDENYSSQSLFPADLLTGLRSSIEANAKTVSKIKSITFKIECNNLYSMEGSSTIDVWIQNSSSDYFNTVNGSAQWFEIEDATHGQLVIDDPESVFLDYAYGIVELTIELDKLFEYTDESIILTFKSNGKITETTYGDWFAGYFTFNPDLGRTLSGSTQSSNITGTINHKQNLLPVLNFTYETETQELKGEETRGDATEWATPGFEALNSFGSDRNSAPFESGYKYGVAQMLYTSLDLQNLISVTAESITNAEINGIDMAYTFIDYGGDPDIDYEVYVELVEDEDFPRLSNNKATWFDFDRKSLKSSGNISHESCYDETCYLEKIHVDFDKPLLYTGQSLLVTVLSESKNTDGRLIGGITGFESKSSATSVVASYEYSKEHDQILETAPFFEETTTLPAIKFYYVPVTVASSVKVAQIENAKVGVKASEDNTYNILTLDFDINDPSDCNNYEVQLNNTTLGTVEGSHVTVSYLDIYKNEAAIKIVPKTAEGKDFDGVVGTSYNIEVGAHNHFFKDFTVETVSTRGYGYVDINKLGNYKTFPVYGAAVVKYVPEDGAAPVKKMGSSTAAPVKGSVSPSYDWSDDMFTLKGDSKEFAANEGLRYFETNENWYEGTFVKNVATVTSQIMTVNLFLEYPVAKATPVLTDEVPEKVTTTNVKSKTIKHDIYVDLTDPDIFITEVKYHDKDVKVIGEADGSHTYYAPQNQSLWIKQESLNAPAQAPAKVAARVAEDEEAKTVTSEDLEKEGFTNQGQHFVHNPLASQNTRLYVAAVNSNGEVTSAQSVDVNNEGGMSGIGSVAADPDAPVEYYNLQGIRVAQPTEGGLYIRRQGGISQKVRK